MVTTPWLPTVTKIADGEDVSAEVVNPILAQYTQRDQFLYETLLQLNDKSSLLALQQAISPSAIGPDALAVGDFVFASNDGLRKALASFSSNGPVASYIPDQSSFTVGMVSNIQGNFADVRLSGLVPVDISTMLQTGETFRIGAYYLSTTENGKITAFPGGINVFVGYAKSSTEFFININLKELLQTYIFYKFLLLDRPAGAPAVSLGIWTVTNDLTKLGWIDVKTSPPTGTPAGAKFKYNIPSNLALDTTILQYDIDMADALRTALPPQPLNFTTLTVNGVSQRFYDANNTDGLFTVNQFGIFWFADKDGYQPWASDILTAPNGVAGWAPTDWPTLKGSDYIRPRQIIYFSKLNPDIRESIVTSLEPLTPSSLIKFYQKNSTDNPKAVGVAGDLLVDVDLNITEVQESPVTTQCVKHVLQTDNGLVMEMSDMVVAVNSGTGINVSPTPNAPGQYTITYDPSTLAGQVNSLEPENSRFEYFQNSLNSYLRLLDPAVATNPPSGFVGKLLFPQKFGNKLMQIFLQIFGFGSVGSQQNIGLQLDYTTSSDSGVLVNNTTVGIPFDVPMPNPYTANNVVAVAPVQLIIPANALNGRSIVNFRITRTTTTGTAYAGDIGVLGVYWSV